MGKGSDQPTNTTSTVYNSSLPEYARPYYDHLMSATEAESNQPYTAYSGQRIHGFTNPQLGAMGGIQALAQQGNPTVDSAAGLAGASGIAALNAGNYTPMYTGTDQWSPSAASQYMDPYLDNVLNRLQQHTNQNYAEQAGTRQTAAEAAGAYGGSRQAISDMMAQRDLNTQLGDQQANLLSQGYQNAQSMFTTDQARRLQSAQGNQQADLGAANLGLQGAQTAGGIAATLGQLGATQQQGTLDRLNALMGVGNQQQQLGQQGLDQGYQDFVNQRDYQRNNLAFMSGILHGIPVSPNSETIQTSPGPNAASQALGLGIAGQSLNNLSGNG